MVRPVPSKYPVNLEYKVAYSSELAHVTKDGFHHGLDFLTPEGVSVYNITDGIINEKAYFPWWGNVIFVKFWRKSGLFSQVTYRAIYAHLSKILTNKNIGEKVKEGELLGLTGKTGWVTGPHLHFEVQKFDGLWEHVSPYFVINEVKS